MSTTDWAGLWRGKNYVVCGSGHGMGFATARELLGAGANVLVHARREESVAGALEKLRPVAAQGGGRVAGVAADLARFDGASRVAAAAATELGRLHGWVANTGGPKPGRALELTEEHWQSAFENTFLAAVRMVHAAVPLLEPGSAIVAIQSRSIKDPIESLAASNALRSAAVAFLRDAGRELGGKGIRVLSVLPGIVHTERLTELSAHRARTEGVSEQSILDAWGAETAIGRIGTPEDLARVLMFALSDAASYVTGTTILADGGATRSG